MKTLIFVLATMTALLAFASPNLSWVLIGQDHEEESSHDGIRYLIGKYPQAFARYQDRSQSDKISRISLETYQWHYFGETTCVGNDIRLERVYYDVGVCTLDVIGYESCTQTHAEKPTTLTTDPCL